MQPEELKSRRKAAGMSQAELADAIGMSRETIGQMERGSAPIEKRTELAVRHILGGGVSTSANGWDFAAPDWVAATEVPRLLDFIARELRARLKRKEMEAGYLSYRVMGAESDRDQALYEVESIPRNLDLPPAQQARLDDAEERRNAAYLKSKRLEDEIAEVRRALAQIDDAVRSGAISPPSYFEPEGGEA